ncbi:LpxI family protein [Rhodobium gokarnense]|uniref:DUF1009 family protein n=1 Tax=Rhodobium gokarnense TaxID=364296 RepID=A0ABT3HB28_9HYPH|nr:UDP-2,3-diacylglucosamine diphosphatase LpxI [Rhodobium gokarnense]MCW2307603.1 DUF1009 family protein [Rhodobium gokarnense]
MSAAKSAAGPLAIVAGGGALPAEVAAAVAASGRPFIVIAIRGEAGPEMEPFSPHWLDWGQIGRFFDILKSADCTQMVMIGSVTKRPDFRAVAPDLGALARLPKIIAALIGGDDTVLKRVIRIFEDEGLTIVAAQDVAPQLLAPEGVLTRSRPDAEALADIAAGSRLVSVLGSFDIGQGVVVLGGRVAAVEAAEGTDRMLERIAELKAIGRLPAKGRRGVLVKRTKPGQELRTDLPTVGPRTVELAAAASLAGIAVEAAGVLIAEREATVAAADRGKLFLTGIRLDAAEAGA